MSNRTLDISEIDRPPEIDPSTLEQDRFVHLLLTAWTLVPKSEPASGPQSNRPDCRHPPKPRHD
jgi:hypothetical protein